MRRFIALLVPVALFLACASNPHVSSLKIYLQQQNWDKAIEEGKAWQVDEPDNPQAHLWTGVALINKKMYEEAADNFVRAFEIDPSLRDSATLANNLSIGGQALFTVDGVSVTFQNAGATTAQNEEYDRAIRYIDEAIMLTPGDGKLYTLLSGTYQRQGQEAKAREVLEQGVLNAPNDPELHYFFALMLPNEEKDLALEHLNKAVEIDPEYVKAHYQTGVILFRTQEYAAAKASFFRAVELDTTLADGFINLGIISVHEESYSEAEGYFRTYTTLNPEDYQGWSLWGVALYNLEQHQQSLAAFDKSLELYPTNAEVYTYKGLCYKALGMTQESLDAFKKADELSNP
jgi:tetratricopeptide (TPR) repeat protein